MTYHLTVLTFDHEVEIPDVIRALSVMGEESEYVEAIRVGPVERDDQEGDVALFLALPDRDSLRRFLCSPPHDRFLARYRPHMTKVNSIDFDDAGPAAESRSAR